MKLLLALLACISVAYAADPISADPDSGGSSGPDLSGTDLTNNFCELADKKCAGTPIGAAQYAPTPRQCVTRCIRELTCVAIHIDAGKNCQLLSSRCTFDQLTNAPGGVDIYRLNKGDVCPANRPAFVATKVNYSNQFCMAWGKKCPGRTLYTKPQNISPYLECLKKCAKISSCGMVDFANDKCDPKEYSCPESELVDDPDTRNFLRLEEGVSTCSDGRSEPSDTKPVAPPTEPVKPPVVEVPPPPKYCDREFLNCFGHDIQAIGWTFDFNQCKQYCNANDNCKSIHFDQSGFCWLKNYVCSNSQLVSAWGNDAVKVDGNFDCSVYEPKHKYCHYYNQNCLFHDIRTWLLVPNLARCEYYCDYVSNCQSVWWDHILHTCFLKDYKCWGWLLPAIGDYSKRC